MDEVPQAEPLKELLVALEVQGFGGHERDGLEDFDEGFELLLILHSSETVLLRFLLALRGSARGGRGDTRVSDSESLGR